MGRAIAASGIPRSELFVTTKLWIQDVGEGYCPARSLALRRLGEEDAWAGVAPELAYRHHDKGGPMENRRDEAVGGDFAEGEETLPKDEDVGSFAEGEERRPRDEDVGSFAKGEESLPEDDRIGTFADREDEDVD